MIILEYIIYLIITTIAIGCVRKLVTSTKLLLLSNSEEKKKIKTEWINIKQQVSKFTYLEKLIYRHYVTMNYPKIYNTTIFKKYSKEFNVDDIPFDVFIYTASKLYLVDETAKQKHVIPVNKEMEYYKALGIRKTNDMIIIKNRYKYLIKQYHPDKLINVSDSDKKIYEEKTKSINESYNYFKKKYRKI